VSTPDLKPDAEDSVGVVRRYSFLVQPSGSQVAMAMAAYTVEHFTLRRYATFYDPTSAVSLMQARSFENVVKKAGKMVAISLELPQGEADYGPAIARLKDAAAEGVFICGTAEQNAVAARKARELAYRPTLIGNQAWYIPMLEEAGDSAEGAWFAMAVAPDDRALAQLAPRFQAVYGELPRPEVVSGYEAVGLVLAAVRRAGSVEPLKVRDALEQTAGYKGLLSTFDMDRKSHRTVGLPVAIMRIIDGSYVTAEARFVPKSPRNGSTGPQ
jgi:branched-chain amino acid transport system substrate-binding protein